MSYAAKVLIVDDEPRMCDSLKVLLGNEGYEIQTRHSGQEALEVLDRDDFDLVLLDLVLPDISSAEIIDNISSHTPGTPVIVITGHASLDSAIDSLKKGAFDYLRKPFEHEELSKAVKNALDQKALKKERKQLEEALRESEQKYKALYDNAVVAMFRTSLKDGQALAANDTGVRMFGYSSKEEFLSEFKASDHYVDPDERRRLLDALRMKGEVRNFQTRFSRKDGTPFWVECSARIYPEDGYLEGAVVDITERKLVQEALRESEEKFRVAFENTRDAIFWADPETGLITNCNRAAEILLEKTKAEIIGTHQTTLHPPERAQDYESMFKRHLQKKGAVDDEAEVMTGSGRIVPVHISASATVVGGKLIIQGLFRDINERKRAEEALVRAKEDWENTFDATTDMIMLLDDEHRILRSNRAAAEALNTTKESLVGKKCYEAVHGQRRRIGECPLALTIKTLKPQTTEITEPKLGGTFICSTSPMLNREGKLTGYTHTLKDITESKHLEAQFQQAQKMEAIGTLAGGIAHDFNNLLTGIQGNVSLMFLDIDTTHPHYERLKSIEKQVQSGARLTSHLLGYARKGKYEVKPVDLNHLLRQTSDTFGRTKKDVSIYRQLTEKLFAIKADSGQIEQVLWNLLVNAADAMPGGGDLILKTDNVTHKDMKGKLYDPKPGNYVRLTVTDTGVGMSKKTMERIFDPFFTTKEMGRGTGLGLASAYGIIKAHAGYIDVESEKGLGTTFSIYLPSSKKEVQKVVKATQEVIEGTGTVLLIDDEELILEVGQDLLEAMGYRVLTARDGKEAIEIYKDNRDKIDLVILDMVMPHMGGGEVYDKMKEINPDVKVLLSSGYSIDSQAKEILARGCDAFIQKPFGMRDLSQRIREVLEKE